MKLGHVNFQISNLKQSLNFYCDILGFEKAFELDNGKGNKWIYIKVGDGDFIEFSYSGNEQNSEAINAGVGHFCLEVDDINTIADKLEKHEVLDRDIKKGLDGNYQCWTTDPDGHRIEFMEITEDSPQAKSRRQ